MKKCPDEYLGRWFSILYRMSMSHVTQGLKEYNIGSGQVMFLLELYYCDGVRQEELSTLLQIDRANTTRAIAKLEQEGYVERHPDPDDGRAYRIFLTDKALQIKPDLFELLRSWDENLLSALDSEEQETFIALLKKMGHLASDSKRCVYCHLSGGCQ
ncbi:MAG: MarR family transcriptional regulator [Firmicutes bacterium]|nr:MarR family transcriptional regulator [Bacillota bacterium]